MKKILSLFACAALLLGTRPLCRAQDEAAYQKLLQGRSASIVTLRVVSKMEINGAGQDRSSEMRSEIQGVVVDKEGLIMVSNIFLNPYSLSMGDAAAQAGIKMTPTSIKVVFTGDEKEYNAFLAATDTKLNLAFVKVEDLSGKVIAPVEFTGGVTPTIGQRLLSVSRLPRGYDYSAFLQSGHINGEIVRPRKAWMLEGNITGFGLPIYTVSGELVGVLTSISSSIKEDTQNPDTMGMMMMMRMLGGGGGSILQPFLVPSSAVEGVITQAKTRAVEVAAKRKNGKADAGTPEKQEPSKKTEPAKKSSEKPKKP